MEDQAIVDLYWAREEQALQETDKKHGPYCQTIAWNILRCRSDAEECVNDTWLRAWNTMPPQRPAILSSFLGTITRNLSLDRYREKQTKKRGGGIIFRAWEELDRCVPAGRSLEEEFGLRELSRLLDQFLRKLPERERCVFLRRYWYTASIADIAHHCRMTEGAVKASLHRTRKKLQKRLEEEGVKV